MNRDLLVLTISVSLITFALIFLSWVRSALQPKWTATVYGNYLKLLSDDRVIHVDQMNDGWKVYLRWKDEIHVPLQREAMLNTIRYFKTADEACTAIDQYNWKD